MAIKIYSCENSRGVRPIWTAEEMGLDYELIMMPFPPRVFMKEYLETNILGTVPFMVDGSVKMTESVAISQYLEEKYGPSDLQVTPDEDDYPNYLNWLFHSDATLTFPQPVVLRYKLQEPGFADAAVEEGEQGRKKLRPHKTHVLAKWSLPDAFTTEPGKSLSFESIPPVTNTEIESNLHILSEPDTVVPPGFFEKIVLSRLMLETFSTF